RLVVVGPDLLHVPDLLRFLRLFRHGHRASPHVWLHLPRELRSPLCVPIDNRVLATLAHLTLKLVSRLCVYPAGREPAPSLAGLSQPVHRLLALRLLARSELELRGLGPVPGSVPGHRENGARPCARTILETGAAFLPGGRCDGWLGLLQARDDGTGG